MPSDFALKTMNQIHRGLMTISGGRFGWTVDNMAVLELTTTGRKSGQPRSTMLTVTWRDGDTVAIVASRGGDDHDPAWFLNLRDDPAVTVRTKDGTRAMTARIVSSSERSEIWSQITAKHSNYAGYQSKTDREIPVVVLEPAD